MLTNRRTVPFKPTDMYGAPVPGTIGVINVCAIARGSAFAIELLSLLKSNAIKKIHMVNMPAISSEG
jgi:hypothetical protein